VFGVLVCVVGLVGEPGQRVLRPFHRGRVGTSALHECDGRAARAARRSRTAEFGRKEKYGLAGDDACFPCLEGVRGHRESSAWARLARTTASLLVPTVLTEAADTQESGAGFLA
jgi:hypothetical protein